MIVKNKACRICKEKKIYKFLDLGNMPLPNGFLKATDLQKTEPKYNLSAGICRNCNLMQLIDVVDPNIMFQNYVYIPSASQTRMLNFTGIVKELTILNLTGKKSLAIDIGSNDGSQLLEFKKKGISVLGVDPAENLSKIAELKGVPTLNTYFSEKTAVKIVKEFGKADYITATNVVAHIDDLHDFFTGISVLLGKNGVFLCEFPYVVDLLQKNLFDTIYQEHLSYFSATPLVKMLNKHKLKIIRIRRTAIDGGALRLIIAGNKGNYPPDDHGINELIALEKKMNLEKLSVYKNFGNEVKKLKKNIMQTLKQIKKEGKTIAGYGAAARGNILLNFCEIGQHILDFIVDSTPYKQGLFTPGTKIQILPEEEIINRKPDYVLVLAWNFAEEIITKQEKYQDLGGKFIIPVPYVKVI